MHHSALKPGRVQRARLKPRFDRLDARLFDCKLERDAKSGKLDKLARKALADHKAGRTRDL